MAKTRSKSRTTPAKGISVTLLYLLAVVCFIFSRYFEGKIEVVNYGLAIVGFGLFALAFWKYFKGKKR